MATRKIPGDRDRRTIYKRIDKLISDGEYVRARPLLRQLLRQWPDDPFAASLLAITYAESNQSRKAIEILEDNLSIYSDHHEVLFTLGEVYLRVGKHELAEKTLRKSLALTPRDMPKEMSQCWNSLGVALWEMRRREEAREAWSKALSIDPSNRMARKNLDESTNLYREPKAPSPIFDDVYHFQKIQMDRYWKKAGRTEFLSADEANRVIGQIMTAWNENIAPLREKLDAMTAAEKTLRFSDVTVDFESPVPEPPVMPPSNVHRLPSVPEVTDEEGSDALKFLDSLVPFLPPGGGLTLLFGMPLLAAAGMEEKRVKRILKGEKASGEEQRILSWANDVMKEIISATEGGGDIQDQKLLRKAAAAARERLPWELAAVAVSEVAYLMTVDPDEVFPEEAKPRRRKKKGRKGKHD